MKKPAAPEKNTKDKSKSGKNPGLRGAAENKIQPVRKGAAPSGGKATGRISVRGEIEKIEKLQKSGKNPAGKNAAVKTKSGNNTTGKDSIVKKVREAEKDSGKAAAGKAAAGKAAAVNIQSSSPVTGNKKQEAGVRKTGKGKISGKGKNADKSGIIKKSRLGKKDKKGSDKKTLPKGLSAPVKTKPEKKETSAGKGINKHASRVSDAKTSKTKTQGLKTSKSKAPESKASKKETSAPKASASKASASKASASKASASKASASKASEPKVSLNKASSVKLSVKTADSSMKASGLDGVSKELTAVRSKAKRVAAERQIENKEKSKQSKLSVRKNAGTADQSVSEKAGKGGKKRNKAAEKKSRMDSPSNHIPSAGKAQENTKTVRPEDDEIIRVKKERKVHIKDSLDLWEFYSDQDGDFLAKVYTEDKAVYSELIKLKEVKRSAKYFRNGSFIGADFIIPYESITRVCNIAGLKVPKR